MIALRAVPAGVLLPVYAQPGARQEKLVGEHLGCLKLAVTAPPENGAANAALVDLLARLLDLRRGQIHLTAGGTQRRKQFTIEGLTPDELQLRLQPLLG